ncbi:MAG: DUF3794 domain-containing protein [Corallococcus sp.]|nr:DUF3794 domain-containing protein [Corallococcus sp.]MCM1359893.1 DUF3794 domain-containing protein [Corallococcus sp.]MCM1395327.1 DUF3794 domain-containing protein [Corallococcus sp.]
MSNLQYQNTTSAVRVTVGKIQTAENIRLSVKNDIAEVLSVGIDSTVNSYEATEGEVTVYGKTAIKFLYNDGASVAAQTYNADFSASLQDPQISPDAKLCFDAVTVDVKVDTNANTATLAVLLEITAYAYVTDSLPVLSGGEDVFVKTENLEILQSADILNITAVIDEQLTSSKTISTVLLAESCLCVTDYTNAEGVLRVAGEATVRLTYLSEGGIVTDTLPFRFERELDATGIPQQAQLKISPVVRGTKVRLDIAEDSVNTDFTVEIVANLCVESCVVGVVEVVTDAYGSACDFEFNRKTLSTTLPCGSVVAKKTTDCTLPLDAGKNVITAVNVGSQVTKCTSMEKCAQVEGIIFATVLSQAENGIESTRLELPFIQTVEIDYLAPQCASFATANVIAFALTDASGLSAKAELCIAVDSCRTVEYGVITEAYEKPFDKTQLPAIEVCLAHKGETLWELAKGLHMSEEDLLSVNPEITNPLDKDARIVVYNKI